MGENEVASSTADRLERRLRREQRARREAEAIAERATRQLYETVRELERVNEELARANRAKDEILAIAWHEVRTPLAVARGFAELLASRWEQFEDAERREFARAVAQRTRSLTWTLEELSLASALQSGEVEASFGAFRLDEMLGAALGEIDAEADQIELSCPVGVTVNSDPRHVRTIVRVFLSNAFIHGEPPIRVEVADGDGPTVLRVIDHGPGVPPDFEPQLFEPFTQQDRSSTRRRGGPGLGLYVACELAQVCGHEVDYETLEEGGACFALRFTRALDPGGRMG